MAISFVAAVEGYGITRHETSHDTTQMNVSAPEQEMEMVGKQGPCITTDLSDPQNRLEAGQEVLVILVVPEDPAPLNSPGYDVLKEARGIESWLARHGSDLSGHLVEMVDLGIKR